MEECSLKRKTRGRPSERANRGSTALLHSFTCQLCATCSHAPTCSDSKVCILGAASHVRSIAGQSSGGLRFLGVSTKRAFGFESLTLERSKAAKGLRASMSASYLVMMAAGCLPSSRKYTTIAHARDVDPVGLQRTGMELPLLAAGSSICMRWLHIEHLGGRSGAKTLPIACVLIWWTPASAKSVDQCTSTDGAGLSGGRNFEPGK